MGRIPQELGTVASVPLSGANAVLPSTLAVVDRDGAGAKVTQRLQFLKQMRPLDFEGFEVFGHGSSTI
jgi:hypothetical protein